MAAIHVMVCARPRPPAMPTHVLPTTQRTCVRTTSCSPNWRRRRWHAVDCDSVVSGEAIAWSGHCNDCSVFKEKGWHRFFAAEVAQAHSDEAKELFGGQTDALAQGQDDDVWLRVRMANLRVLSLRTTVRAIREFLRDASQTFSARRRIIVSISARGTSRSNVSSAEMDLVGRSETTGFSSIPRASS
jgi:hypothetical protein